MGIIEAGNTRCDRDYTREPRVGNDDAEEREHVIGQEIRDYFGLVLCS